MSSNAGGPRRSADAEKDLAALNKELAWELSKAAVDAAGIIDPTPISDGIGAAMSLADGDFVGAGLSLVSMVPYLGDAVGKTAKGARAAAKLNKLRKQIAAATAEIEAIKKAEKAAEAAKNAAKNARKASNRKPKPCNPCVSPSSGIVAKGGKAGKKGWGKGQIPCFAAGTLIPAAAGFLPIESIQPGEEILSYDFSTGQVVLRPVLATSSGHTSCWVEIKVEGTTVQATRRHPIWVESAGEWKLAARLRIGSDLRNTEGELSKVESSARRQLAAPETTYNLTVAGTNNFFVGQPGFLVHNSKSRLNRPGYRNYVLTDKNGKVYYSGMFGPKQTPADVERRHAANRDRFNPRKGDKLEIETGTRTYGEARRLEHEIAVKEGTYIGRDGKTYRGNRQYPMSEGRFKAYYPKDAC